MKKDNASLWNQCLALIKAEVSEQHFSTWFSPINFEVFNEERKMLVLQVPNVYVHQYLEENYISLLKKVITENFGQGVSLCYRLMDRQKKPTPMTFESESETVSGINTTPLSSEEANTTVKKPEGRKRSDLDPQLNPKQTFASYIEGDSNKLARSVGLSVAEHPGKTAFNPFFVYGPSGCGKTHLINAIGVKCKETYPKKRVLYVSARLFQLQFTESSRQNTTNDFLKFYQSIDVLIVDDVQEWTTEATLNAFFHIFNHLSRLGKQIILACDRKPVEMQGLDERMLTRFSSGLVAPMDRPNPQLCKDILNAKCRRENISIPDDVIGYIAETVNGSIRDLEGVINSLLAYSVVYNSNIDMKLAERVIKRAVKKDDRPLTVDDILDKVCAHFDVNQQAVMSKSRSRQVTNARQTAMFFASKYAKLSASRIGQLIGNRDHSTVIHSCSVIEKRIKEDPDFAAGIEKIEKSFQLK